MDDAQLLVGYLRSTLAEPITFLSMTRPATFARPMGEVTVGSTTAPAAASSGAESRRWQMRAEFRR
jgi:hypothetical protein